MTLDAIIVKTCDIEKHHNPAKTYFSFYFQTDEARTISTLTTLGQVYLVHGGRFVYSPSPVSDPSFPKWTLSKIVR